MKKSLGMAIFTVMVTLAVLPMFSVAADTTAPKPQLAAKLVDGVGGVVGGARYDSMTKDGKTFSRLGVKLELVPVVASNRIQFLQQGKIDLMIATMSDTPERRKIVDILDPNYYGSGTNVLVKKSEGLKSWDQLRGKKVCLIQGAFYNKELQEKYGVEGVAFPGTSEAMTALRNGNCLAYAYDDTQIVGEMQKPEWTDYEMPLNSILVVPWGVAVKQGEKALGELTSKAIVDWHKTGFIRQLETKWGIKPTKFAEEMQAKYK